VGGYKNSTKKAWFHIKKDEQKTTQKRESVGDKPSI
jgi:hypothetical protein